MKRILVTGSTGFIGKYTIDSLLKKNVKVYSIIRKSKKNIKLIKKIKKENQNFYAILFNKNTELKKKIFKVKPDVLINLATNYITNPNHKEIPDVINSNITFPTIVLDESCKNKKIKVINICSLMQCANNKIDNPENFYALTKILFKNTMTFYQKKYPKNVFINLYIGDTYGSNDSRKKILPTIYKNYIKNKKTVIQTKNLQLNILHVHDVVNGIKILVDKIKKSSNFFIRSNTKFDLIKVINKYNSKKRKKIKLVFNNNKISKINRVNLRPIPKWKQKINVINTFYNDLNESN